MAEWIARAKEHAYSVTAGKIMTQLFDYGVDVLDVEKIKSGDFDSDYIVMKIGLPLGTAQQLDIGKAILTHYGIET